MSLINEAADFKEDELFFSVTDKKGIILGGNEVFTRISEYSDFELFQKPHNFIRHPDMPKTIFRLFWSYIKDDKNIAAYVKNKTKSGRYYWVLALVFPIKAGYLSIRLKPTTELLGVVEGIYKELKIREEENNDLDVHVEWLLNRLNEMGFKSYDAFIEYMLPKELLSRNKVLGNHAKVSENSFNMETYVYIDKLMDSISIIEKENEKLQNAFSDVGMITKNLLIASAHLGSFAKTLTTIGTNLQLLTNEVKSGAQVFQEQFSSLIASGRLIKLMAMVHFQVEIINACVNEEKSDVFVMTVEKCRGILQNLINENLLLIQDVLLNTDVHYLELENSISDFVRIALGMNVICITGKIEIAHLSSHKNIEELQEQLMDLKEKNEEIKSYLNNISEQLIKIGSISKTLDGFILDLYKRFHV